MPQTTTDAQADTGPDTGTEPEPQAAINFFLRNDSATPVYLYLGCVLDLNITSLADPTKPIGRTAGCGCSCSDPSCTSPPLCGGCFQGSVEVAATSSMSFTWEPVDLSYEARGTFSCVRVRALPAGDYRIDVPVYATAEDAATKTNARIASRTFTVPGGTVIVSLSASP
jgi:hypothetical protein